MHQGYKLIPTRNECLEKSPVKNVEKYLHTAVAKNLIDCRCDMIISYGTITVKNQSS